MLKIIKKNKHTRLILKTIEIDKRQKLLDDFFMRVYKDPIFIPSGYYDRDSAADLLNFDSEEKMKKVVEEAYNIDILYVHLYSLRFWQFLDILYADPNNISKSLLGKVRKDTSTSDHKNKTPV